MALKVDTKPPELFLHLLGGKAMETVT